MDGGQVMASKSARQIKSRGQFVATVTLAAVLCVVSGWVVLKRFTGVPIAPSTLDPLPVSSSESTKAAKELPSAPGSANAPTAPVQSAPTATIQSAPPAIKQATQQPPGTAAIRQGVFRIGNPTGYPVRVALLPQKVASASARTDANATTVNAVNQPRYELPAHWDFAPKEGGTQGLLVSLPDRTLKLKKGDILVAFAQDGSGRYWGPYVVDETALPLWNAKAVEWQLILQP